MNSLIGSYAREIKQDGKQTGQMFLNEEDAKAVAMEVERMPQFLRYLLNGALDIDL